MCESELLREVWRAWFAAAFWRKPKVVNLDQRGALLSIQQIVIVIDLWFHRQVFGLRLLLLFPSCEDHLETPTCRSAYALRKAEAVGLWNSTAHSSVV